MDSLAQALREGGEPNRGGGRDPKKDPALTPLGLSSQEEAELVAFLKVLAGVELGKLLFFDPRLSGDGSISCASCHAPSQGWGDGNDLSRGYPGTQHWRNSKTVLNAAYFRKLFWTGEVTSLESQANAAITGNLAGNGDPMMIEERLRQIPEYVKRFKEVFGRDPLYSDALKAIATFERVVPISRSSREECTRKRPIGATIRPKEAPMHLRHRLAALLILTVVLTALSPAQAFKTFRAFGGAVHEQITREAIGDDMSQEAFIAIDQAMTRQDVPGTKHFEEPANHFVDGELRHGIRYVRDLWGKAKDYARDADKDHRLKMRVYDALGGIFHAIQDFYAHSNYIELTLKAGTPPDAIEPFPWESKKKPKGVRTGYFFYQNAAIHELTFARAASIYNIHKTYPGAKFVNDVAYERMRGENPTYEQAIAYATGDHDFLHKEVDKDNASSSQGRIVHPGSGLTLHEIARRVAVKDTRRIWQMFAKQVAAENGERGPAILAAIRGSSTSYCPPFLAGYPLTTDPEFQGKIKVEKGGALLTECKYGDETDRTAASRPPAERRNLKIHVKVLWGETPLPAGLPDCRAFRQSIAQMNAREGRTEIRAKPHPTRFAAWSFSTVGMPEGSKGEIQGFAERLLASMESRAAKCIDVEERSQAGRWSCEIQEHPIAGGGDHWGVRYEDAGNRRIIHLVQDPTKNPFDKQRPGLPMRYYQGMSGAYTLPLASARQRAEESCEQFQKTGR